MNCRLKTILSRWGIFTSRSTLKWPRQLKSGADLCLIKTKKKKKKKKEDCERYHRGATLASVRSYHLRERHSIRLPSDEKCRRLNVTVGKGRLLRWRQRHTRRLRASSPPRSVGAQNSAPLFMASGRQGKLLKEVCQVAVLFNSDT